MQTDLEQAPLDESAKHEEATKTASEVIFHQGFDEDSAPRGGSQFDEESLPVWTAHYEGKPVSMKGFFPPLVWFPRYMRVMRGSATDEDRSEMGKLPYSIGGDMIAGLTVGIMLVPQCLAFAMLAGLPVQAGLYSSFMPLVMYSMFGTIRHVQPGPTALISLLSGQALDALGLEGDVERMAGAAFMAAMVGATSVLMGAFRAGFIVDFMSHTVMTAFCSAAGITIGSSQLKNMLGIDIPREKYWWKTIGSLIVHIDEAEIATIAIGFTLLSMLLVLKYWKSAGSKQNRQAHRVWRFFPTDKSTKSFKCLKVAADLSSLIAVVVGWTWGYIYRQCGVEGVKFVGDVDSNGFVFVLPGEGFFGELTGSSALFISAVIIAIVGFLETMAVGGKFAAQYRYGYEPNQELIALGFSNIASAFMSGYPGTGSFTRTAVNAMFGATSQIACAISSTLVLGAVYFLLPVIAKLPNPCLSPIILQGAIGVISVRDFKVAFKANRAEFFVMVATFVVSLALTVKEGLLTGFVLSILKTMFDLANPNMAVLGKIADGAWRDVRNFPHAERLQSAVIVRMDARLNFANSRKMKEFCIKAVNVREKLGDVIEYLIIDSKAMNHVDITGCEMLEVLAETLQSQGKHLILANVKGPVGKCLARAGVPANINKHDGHLCTDMESAIAITSKRDPDGDAARKSLTSLIKNHDLAQVVLQQNKQQFYKCNTTNAPSLSPKNTGSKVMAKIGPA